MLIELCVLASGSSGNCSMLRTPGGVVLIDAGLQPRTAAKRMDGTGVVLSDVAAVCVTHLDRDHFSSAWAKWAMEHHVPIYCHRDCAESCIAYVTRDFELEPAGVARFRDCLRTFDESCFEPVPGLRFTAIHLPHDREGSHGFVVDGFGCRLGYATDFGHVPPDLFDHFDDLNLLAIESNYDPSMQHESSRPAFQKQRIMGGAGHLSNEQAFDAVRAILDRSAERGTRTPSHIVLLHRSRQCNCPKRVREIFSRDRRILPRLVLAEQFQRSEWLRPAPVPPARGEQLLLAFQ